jgi:signal transduction histidine kinase/CheY-like chemotaxis protein
LMRGILKRGAAFPCRIAMNLFSLFSIDEPLVEHELFVLSFRNLGVHIVGQILLSSVVAMDSWTNCDHDKVLAWAAWIIFSTVVLVSGLLVFYPHAKAPADGKILLRWRLSHALMLSIIGIGWGGTGFLLVPQAHDQNLMVMIAFSGVFAYSAATNAPQDPFAFGVSAVIGTVLLMSQIPAAFGTHATSILGMCILYFFSLIFANRNARNTLLTSIKLRLINETLARENAKNAARAEQANRDKSDFLAAASHDLRQPVHALLLLIEAYRQQVPAANEHPLMQHIAEAGQSIRDLFNALMELSRLDSGTEQVSLSSVDLHGMLHRLQSRVQPEAQRKGLTVRRFESTTLKQRSILTDGLLLERILGNLLSNAVRYTEAGGILVSLRPAHSTKHPKTSTNAPQDGGLWLEVWDTGIGIAASEHARIFDPYVQIGNSERDRSKGLGLGLAIVRHAAVLLGLELSVLSRQGKGSCFRLYLPPQLYEPGELRSANSSSRALPIAGSRLSGRRILLVEDDPMALHAMQSLLAGWRIDLRCASRGDTSVLNVCSSDWVPECVLCDFRLPGPLDGIAVLSLLLEKYPEAIGILQTGELAKHVMARAEEAGYMVLFKPVDPTILGSTLNTIFDRHLVKPSLCDS